MFRGCRKLESLYLDEWDVTNVRDMSCMFKGCHNIERLDGLFKSKTTNVEDMSHMFEGCCWVSRIDLSNFDTSGVKNMNHMFCGCERLEKLDLTSFDTSAVVDMSEMFKDCGMKSLKLGPKFVIKSDANIDNMFSRCENLTKIEAKCDRETIGKIILILGENWKYYPDQKAIQKH